MTTTATHLDQWIDDNVDLNRPLGTCIGTCAGGYGETYRCVPFTYAGRLVFDLDGRIVAAALRNPGRPGTALVLDAHTGDLLGMVADEPDEILDAVDQYHNAPTACWGCRYLD